MTAGEDFLDETFVPSPAVDRWLQERSLDDESVAIGMASYFQATKDSLKQNKDGSFTLSLKVAAGELPVWLTNAPMTEELLMGAIDRGPGDDGALSREREERAADAKRKLSTFPQDPVFQQWLVRYDHWGLIAHAMTQDSEAIEAASIETLKRLCGIASRRHLSSDRDALERFESLMGEFYRDMSLSFKRR